MRVRVMNDRKWMWIAGTAVLAGAATLLLLLTSGYGAENYRGAIEPQRAELPAGYDPIPHFEGVRRELEFRGAECLVGAPDPYRLYRRCGSLQ